MVGFTPHEVAAEPLIPGTIVGWVAAGSTAKGKVPDKGYVAPAAQIIVGRRVVTRLVPGRGDRDVAAVAACALKPIAKLRLQPGACAGVGGGLGLQLSMVAV